MRVPRGELLAVGGLCALLTIVLTYPLSTRPGSAILSLGADMNLYLWTVGWNAHALAHDPLSIFDANIYFPYDHTLAYSENAIGSSLIAAPVIWMTGNVALGLNLTLLLSCVLCGMGAYLLARRAGLTVWAAVLAALVFAFAPPRFFRLGQLHLTTVQWLPFCLAFLYAYLEGGRRRDLMAAVGFFVLQALTSGHGAIFTALSGALLAAWRVVFGPRPIVRVPDLAIAALALVIPAALLIPPYQTARREAGLQRPLAEAAELSPNAASLVASPTHVHAFVLSRIGDGRLLERANAALFPGYVTLFLAAAALATLTRPRAESRAGAPRSGWRAIAFVLEAAFLLSTILAIVVTLTGPVRIRSGGATLLSAQSAWRAWMVCAGMAAMRVLLARRVPVALVARARGRFARVAAHAARPAAFFLVLAGFSLWVALGPAFGLYALLYPLPGFDFVRVPARFTIVTVLALAVLAGFGLDGLMTRLGRWRTAFAVVVAVLFVAESAAMPLAVDPYSAPPALDRWLDGRAKPFSVVEFPSGEHWQSVYMLHAMAHWQKTVHGYSGVRPAFHQRLYEQLERFPDAESLRALGDLGVSYVVVHAESYAPERWPAIESALARSTDWLTLLHRESDGRIYALHAPRAAGSAAPAPR